MTGHPGAPKTPLRDKIEMGLVSFLLIVFLLMILTGGCPEAKGQVFVAGIEATSARKALGKKFFHDPRVSRDGTISCATCHVPELGYTDGNAKAIGIDGRIGQRNTPTVLGAFQSPGQFWDVRTVGANIQALQPLTNQNEMGNRNRGEVYARLNQIPYYVQMARDLYGQPRVNDLVFGHSIHCFECDLWVSSPIDRFLAGDVNALSPDAAAGYELCRVQKCFECHKPPFYTDNAIHNVGSAFLLQTGDQGREGVTQDAISPEGFVERRAFKTPTLRALGLTAPYMHDGSVATIERVVDLFADGFTRPNNTVDRFMDPRIHRTGWDANQRRQVATFLREAFAPDRIPGVERPPLP